ncbi:uncharacterized protein B0P05DRAFT_556545 [Gilbertella persicaria]|uniref:uncharacterized protein n=1 Tax=Gilbertella persicaria TaxID=101096 RepID=UPI00221F7609|nr:uncharacterized protein B0P05DRAFT_556545 [Gilbertella persicaria]KAI8062328.1 hypothetical protein B0P05DRAFT_556545 [Gilbertella persicaria]
MSISTLKPDAFRCDLTAKVLEHVMTVSAKQADSDALLILNEYLIGDDSGCVVLNTKQDLTIDTVYDIKNAYTQATEGYLRVYANDIETSSASLDKVNTENNKSLVFMERITIN